MGNKKQIIVGAADVYLGPSGTGLPAYTPGTKYRTTLAGATGATSTTDPTLVTNWRSVGYTQNGFELSYQPNYTDVQVDQLLDAAKVFKDGMTATLKTTFAEATLDNLLIAWGQLATTVSSVGVFENELAIEAGSLGIAPVERGLIAIGNSPEHAADNNYGERVYHAFRVLSVDSAAHTLDRSAPTVVPVSFRALPDDTTARYGAIRDRLNV